MAGPRRGNSKGSVKSGQPGGSPVSQVRRRVRPRANRAEQSAGQRHGWVPCEAPASHTWRGLTAVWAHPAAAARCAQSANPGRSRRNCRCGGRSAAQNFWETACAERRQPVEIHSRSRTDSAPEQSADGTAGQPRLATGFCRDGRTALQDSRAIGGRAGGAGRVPPPHTWRDPFWLPGWAPRPWLPASARRLQCLRGRPQGSGSQRCAGTNRADAAIAGWCLPPAWQPALW
jgi:hypothetical protein